MAGERVLVVDSEAAERDRCRDLLRGEGYPVTAVADGADAVSAFAEAGDFAAVVLELPSPALAALELIRQLAEIDPDAILLVGYAEASVELVVHGTRRGAYGFVNRPYVARNLLQQLRHGLERRALARESRLLREERERRLLELAFERSKASTIINCLGDGVLVVNRQGQMVLANAALGRLWPQLASMPLPVPLAEVMPPASLRAWLEDAIGDGAEDAIMSHELADGGRTYMVNVGPVCDSGGEHIGAVAVLRDITDLKRLEQAKSSFVRMVSHEVRNPLAVVEQSLEMVLAGDTPDPARNHEWLESALSRVVKLRLLVGELLQLSVVEAGQRELRRTVLDAGQVLAGAVERHAAAADARGVRLICERPPDGWPVVLADPQALDTILDNLVDNAIKYTPAGGLVELLAGDSGAQVCLRVRDTGVGLSPEECDMVFDEFYRARQATMSEVPGTGLGLALVRRLTELHGGYVILESEVGRGSTFGACFPAAPATLSSPVEAGHPKGE